MICIIFTKQMPYKISTNPILKRVFFIMLLFLAMLVLMQLADHPALVERYYSQGLYVFLCSAIHPVLNLFPFSVGDILYISAIFSLIYASYLFFKFIFRKEFFLLLKLSLGLVIAAQTGVLLFYLFWGMNYFRPSAAQRLICRIPVSPPPILKQLRECL